VYQIGIEKEITMRNYLLPIRTVIAVLIVALALFGALTVLFGVIEHAPVVISADVQAQQLAAPARRAISIPYGISSPLTLTADGTQLSVTGHGVCWDEGQMFDLHVRVAQSTTNAFAEGHSVDICAGGERQLWDAEATTSSAVTFEAGRARACAEAVEFAQHGIADEYRWCKDIKLMLSNGND
jgi:hypothetical protein